MDDDDTVLFAVLAGLGGLAVLSLLFVGVGVVLLLAWSMSVRPGAPVAVAEMVMATTLPATATVQLSSTAVTVALPLVAAPSELTSTPTTASTATATAIPPTSTPEPTATAAPSATPLPTDTPLPPPTIAPTPTRNLSTLRTWASAVSTPVTDIADALQAAGQLLQAADVGNQQWRQALITQMAIVRASHTRLIAIQAPPEAAPLHAAVTAATQKCSAAMMLLAEGIDNSDAATVQQAAGLMQACAAGIKTAGEQAKALEASIGD